MLIAGHVPVPVSGSLLLLSRIFTKSSQVPEPPPPFEVPPLELVELPLPALLLPEEPFEMA
jgi:hypothetical protein